MGTKNIKSIQAFRPSLLFSVLGAIGIVLTIAFWVTKNKSAIGIAAVGTLSSFALAVASSKQLKNLARYSFGVMFLPVFELAIAYIAMAVILIIRPQGLFGSR